MLYRPDTAIMIGLGLTGAAVPATIWLVLQRQACAALLAVMAVLAVALAEREAGSVSSSWLCMPNLS